MRYFIIANSDCGDQWYSLYKKEFIDNKCVVTFITSSGWRLANILDLIDDKSRGKRNIIYSHINKEYFVNKLRENKLIS